MMTGKIPISIMMMSLHDLKQGGHVLRERQGEVKLFHSTIV